MKKAEFLDLAASKYEELLELENSENLYEYEKQFDEIWRDLGRSVLNKNLGEGGEDRRKKKKIKTSYGIVSVSKSSDLGSMTLAYAVSPYLQEKMLYLGQKEVFAEASDTLEVLLQLKVGGSQIRRLCHYYGDLEEANTILETPHSGEITDKDSTLYIQADGSNIYTDEKWKEVKLGRTFREADIKTQKTVTEGVTPRRTIEKSDYLPHKGSHDEFTLHFDKLIEGRIKQEHKQMIFITDGETWMENWLAQNYDKYPRILDFYHATKPLRALAEKTFSNLEKKEAWIKKQKDRLLNSQVEDILQEIEELENLNESALKARKDLQGYYQNNEHRMDYKKYLAKGWFIGSGAIESAHITVIQKRMKLCGQRWGVTAQPLLNLRAIHQSKKWEKIKELITIQSFKKAA